MTTAQEPLWSRERISEFLANTVGKEDIRTPQAAVRYAQSALNVVAHDYEAARAADQARIQELEAQLAEEKKAYKRLLNLNERNCEDALRIKQSSDAVFSLARIAHDTIAEQRQEIERLKQGKRGQR